MKRCIALPAGLVLGLSGLVVLHLPVVQSTSVLAQEKSKLAAASKAPVHAAEKIRGDLEQVVDLNFDNLPLEAIVDRLRAKFQLNVVLDNSMPALLKKRLDALQGNIPMGLGLGGIGNPPNPPQEESENGGTNTVIPPGFSCKFSRIKLGVALDLFLNHYGLGHVILDDALVIATSDPALELLRQQPVRLDFEDWPLDKAVAEIRKKTGADLILDKNAAKPELPFKSITLKVPSVPLEKAVAMLAGLADLRAVALGKVWLITTPARAAGLEDFQAKKEKSSLDDLAQALTKQPQQVGGLTGGWPVQLVDVPERLLQKEGPAPRGQTAAAKVSIRAAPPAKISEIRKMLAEPIDIDLAPVTLKEALTVLKNSHGFPALVVDAETFKEENPDAPDVHDTQVTLSSLKGIPRAKVLRMILQKFNPRNATYLVRPTYVEITTFDNATPGRQTIQASFVDRPLAEALEELAELSGISIVLDARAGDKAQAPVSARFREGTSLINAVRLLADMADLKVIVVDNMLYVTLRSNGVTFPPSGWPRGKKMESA